MTYLLVLIYLFLDWEKITVNHKIKNGFVIYQVAVKCGQHAKKIATCATLDDPSYLTEKYSVDFDDRCTCLPSKSGKPAQACALFLGQAILYPSFAIEILSGAGHFLPCPIRRKTRQKG